MEREDERRDRVIRAMAESGAPLPDILADCGVAAADFAGWVADGSFASRAAEMTPSLTGEYAPYILHALLASAQKGSVPAMKLYYDLYGTKARASPPTVDPEIAAWRAALFGGKE